MSSLRHCSPSVLHSAHQQHLRAAAAQRSIQHPHRKRRNVTRAQVGDMLDTVVTWGSVAAGAGAVVYSVFYDWKQSSQQQQGQQQDVSLFGPADNTTWAVMGFVSCIPFFNYLGFAQGALTSDNPRVWYWAAALYALPLLHHGFNLDLFQVTMVVLGAAQMQALRIGATEPELQAKLQKQLQPLAVVRTVVNAAGAAAGAAIGSSGSSSGSSGDRQLGQGSSRAVTDVLQPDEGELEVEEAQRQQQEFQEFDRRLQDLSRGDKGD